MKRKIFSLLLINIVCFTIKGQMVNIYSKHPMRNNQIDTTSMYCGKYSWNLGRITSMIEWIEFKRDGNTDSIYVAELNKTCKELIFMCDNNLNYALLDKKIIQLGNDLQKAWKENYDRSSLNSIIRKGILSKKPDAIDKLILEGIQFNEEMKLDSAYFSIKKAIEKDSTRLNYFALIIDKELNFTKDTIKALNYLNKVIIRSKERKLPGLDPHLVRAYIYQRKKQFTLANKDLNHILEKDSNNIQALECRGYTKEMLKDFAGSIADFEKILRCLQRKPFRAYKDSAYVYNSIGWNYYLAKKYALCIEYANRSLLLRPKNAYTLDTKGSGYFGLEDYENCIIEMTKAIKLDPSIANSWYLRGLSYLKFKKQNLAYSDLSRALDLGEIKAEESLRELSYIKRANDVEQKQYYDVKPSNIRNSFNIDGNGIHFFF